MNLRKTCKSITCIRTRRLLAMQPSGSSSRIWRSWISERSRGPESSSLMGERMATSRAVMPSHLGATGNPWARTISEYRTSGSAASCSLVPSIRPKSYWVNSRVHLPTSTPHLYPGCAAPFVKYLIFSGECKLLYKLKIRQASGPDRLSNCMLKEMSHELVPSFTALYNKGDVKHWDTLDFLDQYMCRDTVKQSGLWSGLARWVLCMYSDGCVFTLVGKPVIMKFGLFNKIWPWRSRSICQIWWSWLEHVMGYGVDMLVIDTRTDRHSHGHTDLGKDNI